MMLYWKYNNSLYIIQLYSGGNKVKKKVAIISNTVYQLLVVLQMKVTVFENMDVDLFITDHSMNTKRYAYNGNKLGLFRNVQYIETLDYSRRRGKYQPGNIQSELFFSLKRYNEVKKRVGKIEKYDYFFSANLDLFAAAFYDVLKLKNQQIKLYLFEDGLSVCKAMEVYLNDMQNYINNGQFSSIYKITGYGKAFNEIKGVFLSVPELFSWKRKMKLYKIPKIQKNNMDTINKINTLFGYDNNMDYIIKNKKVIFFEESYYSDGYKVNDQKLLNIIASVAGKQNIMVKLHPRSRENRFKDYDILPDLSIPWEVFYLNNDLSGITLVSIASGCIIHPFLLFDDKQEMVVLLDIARGSFPGILKTYHKFLRDNLFTVYPETFRLLQSEEELYEYFSKEKNK